MIINNKFWEKVGYAPQMVNLLHDNIETNIS